MRRSTCQSLPWPGVDEWLDAVAASGLVVAGSAAEVAPLRLDGSRLYLDRYWREEGQVGDDLLDRAARSVEEIDDATLEDGLARLFADDAEQRRAAAVAIRGHLGVVAGGPGTGKTTTVARILALLYDQALAADSPPPLVAMAAPTGKAAARLEEAVHAEASRLFDAGDLREWLLSLSASTLHRLLGWKPGSHTRFRHDRNNRLPFQVVVVDETSMVSLSLMARLLEAVRPTARLLLVGDPEQLASVEAGAVLGDVVGPASDGAAGPVAGSIVVLRHTYRFGGAIAPLAQAVRDGDAAATLEVLRSGHDDVVWLEDGVDLAPVRDAVVAAGSALAGAASVGDGRAALDALGRFRLLCAHRRGSYGVSTWTATIERWLAEGVDGFAPTTGWYAGQPLLFTENDYGLRLYNGDTGVVVTAADGSGLRAVFERRGELVELSLHRLTAVDTVYAMTVHKAQGSQFDEVALLLPDESSPRTDS